MNMPKVSIIVPVYKAEKYLNRCIDSIIAQTFTDWELLLIDDGSPDRSGEICDEYAQKDTRIRVFHKNNGGVSSARNLGLDNVLGEYVTFVDSDDWLLDNALTLCSSYFGQYEIIRFSMMFVKSMTEEKKRKLILPLSNSKTDILQRILRRNSLLGVWGGIYKRELFCIQSIRFDPKLVMAEDWLVLCQLVNQCHSIIDLPDVCYFYNVMNEESCSNNPSVEKVEQCMIALENIISSIGLSKLYINSFVISFRILLKAMFLAVLREARSIKYIKKRMKDIVILSDIIKKLVVYKDAMTRSNRLFLCTIKMVNDKQNIKW